MTAGAGTVGRSGCAAGVARTVGGRDCTDGGRIVIS